MPRMPNPECGRVGTHDPAPRPGFVPVPAGVAPLLSSRLRAGTAALHRQTEVLLDLPGAIRTRNDYTAWLGRFLGLYEPLEGSLAAFGDWETAGIVPPRPGLGARLTADLIDLGADPGDHLRAPLALLPRLPAFAHALGARYVLEGSTLGGRLIGRELESRIGAEIAGATRFFGGHENKGDRSWRSFGIALDRFGSEHQSLQSDVVAGAERVFLAILAWFTPFREGRA